ncbi:cysteine--tRNA ligase [Devosia rhodophyticola]|uniref:Cysteine--tRNA ligase n=1 Tax=Devosia rhodophyticola TaxID=3026423 RepID=A0ABY7YZ40_9HYPH|nr:cysteine--tRNA ligase [Devosia rhodophyticola]WDR06343.1 cysteine--tRNA ligase [Devosia rhodophyticola]
MTSAKTTINLYNTLTRTKEPLCPLDDNNVRMYVCGPTVYDFAHIGNARPVIVFDVLFRLLRHLYGADQVTYVRNITDVDDKINARAVRDFPDLPLNEAIRRVTEKTAAQFIADSEALGCLRPNHQPRATDFVAPRTDGKPDMISLIATLIGKGNAYEANGEVLFEVTSMPDYGKLSGRNLADNLAGARIAVDAHKKNPADFVLWKQSSADEPGWDSPWGRGRPGWHIECSAMSAAFLGEVFDIHGGGLDLIFPHHENELAQSRCAHGTRAMANIWMHNGFLQVEGQKMSKSLSNFITINDLLETTKFGGQKWHGRVLRLAMLTTHYRQPIDWTADRLFECRSLLYDWNMAAHDAPTQPVPAELLAALCEDLNTSGTITILHALAKSVNAAATYTAKVEAAGRLRAALELIGLYEEQNSDVLLRQEVRDGPGEHAITEMVTARLYALNAKDFATADNIRNELSEQGIALMDYKDSETGERRTKWEIKR